MYKRRTFAAGFFILTAITLLLFTSCNKSGSGILERSPDINVPFGAEAKMQAGELEFEGNLKRSAAGIWSMEITSPETLAGLNISYDDGSGVKAVLDGLELDVPTENIRDGAVFSLIFKAIDCAASAGELSCTSTEDGNVYTGEFSGGTYKLTFDPKSSALTRIEIPTKEIVGEFTGFSIIKGDVQPPEETTVTQPSEETTVIIPG